MKSSSSNTESSGWQKTLKRHWHFIAYGLGAVIFLMFLNLWLWPTPDEYYYATLVNSFNAAWHGELLWSDINTEHVGFIPLLSFIFNSLTGINSFPLNRIPIFFFALGIIYIFYKIPTLLNAPKKERLWMLWLLLLIPGYWLFSVRLMLDIPGAFSVLLVIYLLLKKAPSYQIGLALILVLITKEYYLYLTAPVIVVISLLDGWNYRTGFLYRLRYWIGHMCISFFPSAIAIALLVDFNIFPYPRILDASLATIFGDLYTFYNKILLNILGGATDTVSNIKNIDSTSTNISDTVEIANNAQYSGELPTGAINSANPEVQNRFLHKWWLVYKYNLSEAYINMLILPLTAIGVILQIKKVATSFKKNYEKIRPDIIFGLLLLMFLYFNFHQADFKHGFRISIPIIASLIYFSFTALRKLLSKTADKKISIAFVMLSTLSLFGYWITTYQTNYVGALNNQSLFAWIFSIKIYLFLAIFITTIIYIALFRRFNFRYKYIVLLGLMFIMFSAKFFPYYFDERARQQAHGYDYSLEHATPILNELALRNKKIYINSHPYRTQYYASDPRINNYHTDPPIRRFKERYKKIYFGGDVTENSFTTWKEDRINYVLYINEAGTENQLTNLEDLTTQQSKFKEVNRHEVNGIPQWIIYKISYKE